MRKLLFIAFLLLSASAYPQYKTKLMEKIMTPDSTYKYVVEDLFYKDIPPRIKEHPQNVGIEFYKDAGHYIVFFNSSLNMTEEERALGLPASKVPDGKAIMDFHYDKSGKNNESDIPRYLHVGDTLSTFSVTDTNGEVWNNARTKGAPLILNFWYTGCGPCIAEMPELSKWVLRYPDAHFLAVTWDTPDEIKNIVERHHFRFTQIASDNSLRRLFKVNQTPTTVIIDGQGVIRNITEGTSEEKREAMTDKIDKIISGN